MGRPHSPIDPQQPLAEFASGLLALKIGNGLTYKQMRHKVAFCESVLSEAASGKHLPTWEVTLAYVRACTDPSRDPEVEADWRRRWEQARDQLARGRGEGGGHA